MEEIMVYLQEMEGRLNGRMQEMEGRLDGKMQEMKVYMDDKFESIDERLDAHDRRFEKLENRLDEVQLTIENDIRTYCDALAEGHQITQRRLDEIERQVKDINSACIASRLTILENDVKDLQEKVSRIA